MKQKLITTSTLMTAALSILLLGACSNSTDTASDTKAPAPVAPAEDNSEAMEELFADAIEVSDTPVDAAAAPAGNGSINVDIAAKPPRFLSEYGLFKDLAQQIPNDGVYPYELNNGHFSDGLDVQRFIWMPQGAQATYNDALRFDFPVGTLLLQTFSHGDKRIESRLLLRQAENWTLTAYKWNDEGTDARKAIAGGIVTLAADEGADPEKYIILNMNDCKRCHENQETLFPLGLTARNLNRDINASDGPKNQLAHWVESGILTDAPQDTADYPAGVQWDNPESGTINDRARAWLDINCAHCHNPLGAGNMSGLDLSITQQDPLRIGIYKPPVAAGRGSDGHKFSIDPGSPQTSFIVRRLNSIDSAVMMPPLGRMKAAEAPATLVAEWIAAMKFGEAEAEELKAKQLAEFERLQKEAAELEVAQ